MSGKYSSVEEGIVNVIASLISAAAVAVVVGLLGGPGWAQFAIGYLAYLIVLDR